MKLDFVNALEIGIHDKPVRGLFAQDRRASSHGCIRVDDPLGFAATLFGGGATPDGLAALLPRGQTQHLPYAEPISVIIDYFTAEVDDNGVVLIHKYIYRPERQEQAAASSDTETECAV